MMRSEKEVQDEWDKVDAAAGGGSRFPGMNYEQGLDDAFRWVLGQSDEKPSDG